VIEVIAHRGASAYAAEHSLAAYELAVAQGADRLELDLRPTADGALVVLHDPSLARTAGVPRRLDELTLADVRAACGASAPLMFDEVLERFGATTSYLVELKDPAPEWEHAIPVALARHGLADRAIVQSFDALALRRLKVATPWLRCASLHLRRPRGRTLDALAGVVDAVGVWHRRVDAGLVAAAHALGLGIRAWTVNGTDAVERALRAGADGVITDTPDVAVGLSRRAPAAPLAA
jgi:glycerophosphoryl diester phosphodiesterase